MVMRSTGARQNEGSLSVGGRKCCVLRLRAARGWKKSF